MAMPLKKTLLIMLLVDRILFLGNAKYCENALVVSVTKFYILESR